MSGASQRGAAVPDYCNFGIVLRALFALNAGALVSLLPLATGWADLIDRFLAIAVVLEPATFVALFALCALHRPLAREAVWKRIAAAAVVAGTVTLLIDAMVTLVLAAAAPVPSLRVFGAFGTGVTAAAAAAALASYFEWRARAMSPALATAQLQALQSRIRPHFLFNSLNAAMSLIRTDPARAERVLEDLADLFRMLMSDASTMIPLDEEVALARQYLAIEQVRLGERLQVEWEIHRLPGEHPVPPLLLQPLLENAVRHGIEPAPAGGRVAVRITVAARELIVVVENTYEPQAVRAGNGIALANVRERLMLLYDLEARMRADGDGRIWRTVLTLPLSGRDA